MMIITKKIKEKALDNKGKEGVTIAFLGDSVTQGCFEIYKHGEDIVPVFDKKSSYEQAFYDICAMLYPSVPINIINGGISGDHCCNGAKRVQRDIISHRPDLVVVCYGLNDCKDKSDSIDIYTQALKSIFMQLANENIETIFMTPNMMNTYVYPTIDKDFEEIAKSTADLQNRGIMDKHISAARKVCEEFKIPICDCYSIWKQLFENGVDTTSLLANRINHPTREMNKLFAVELIRTIMCN